jgi:hypothetical protein
MNLQPFLQNFHLACNLNVGNFLGFPRWYQYLQGIPDANNGCIPKFSALSDIWLIVAAIIDILLRIGALAAVGFVVYGGIQFITSQGEPDKAAQARKTITNALIGLVISIAATAAVTFVAGSFRAS